MSDKDIKDLFGDDFEVSCDFLDHAKLRGDIPTPAAPSPNKDTTAQVNDTYNDNTDTCQPAEAFDDIPEYDETLARRRTVSSSSGYEHSRSPRASSVRRTKTVTTKKKKKKKGLPNLGKPLSKTAKAASSGRKALSRIVGPLLRLVSILLIVYILYLLGTRFWSGRSAFGSLSTLLSERNYALGAYLSTGLILLLYGILSLFWSFTGPKTKEDGRIRKLDTGRGFLFFVLIYAGALLAQIAIPLLPSGHSSIEGASAALSIYSGLTSSLFPLCTAGVICCLLRKYIFN